MVIVSMFPSDKSNFKYKARLRSIVSKIKDLPTLPDVVTKIMEMTGDTKSSAEDIAEVIARDQALTVKVLRIANSALYGLRQGVSSLDRAVMTLGLKAVRNLALNVSVAATFPPSADGGYFDRGKFWEHAVGCAVISKVLAKGVGYPNDKLEEVFTAGLLHDVGKIVLDRYLHEEFDEVVKLAIDENIPIIEAENNLLGVTHTEVGHWLSFMWKLPEELQWVIYSHHNPEGAIKEARSLAAIVNLADIFCREKGIGSGGGNFVPPMAENVLNIVGIASSNLEEIMGLIDEEVKKAEDFLDG